MKMKVTIEFEYEATPESYGTDDPVEMARIDEDNFNNDEGTVIGLLSDYPFTAKVTPVH